MKSFQKMRIEDPKLDLRRLLLALSKGHYKESPFDTEVVQEVRCDLRLLCKQAGHGDGLPKTGDVVQEFEVRMIQSLLSGRSPKISASLWRGRSSTALPVKARTSKTRGPSSTSLRTLHPLRSRYWMPGRRVSQ